MRDFSGRIVLCGIKIGLRFAVPLIMIPFVTKKRFVLVVLTIGSVWAAMAQSPRLSRAIPSAAAPGKTTEIIFHGENLAGISNLWTSFPAEVSFVGPDEHRELDGKKTTVRLTLPANAQAGIGAVRLAGTNGVSSLHLLMIDDLPSVSKSGSNKTVNAVQNLRLPSAVDGSAEELGTDWYRFSLRKGRRLSVEVVAARLGSRLDPVVRLLDVKGRELAYCDDAPGIGPDCRFTFEAPASGDYFLELRDANYHGGAEHRYRLRVGDFPLASMPYPLGAPKGSSVKVRILGPEVSGVGTVTVPVPAGASRLPIGVRRPGGGGLGFVSLFTSSLPQFIETEPNDRTNIAEKISIPVAINGRFEKDRDRDYFEFVAGKDERLIFRGKTRSLGSPCDLFFQVQNAHGSKLAEANVTGPDEGTLTNTFSADGTYRLLIEELNRRGGSDFAYRIEIERFQPGFALTADVDKIEAPQGGSFEIKVGVARHDYSGPITVSLEGPGNDLVLEKETISGKTNATLTVKLSDRLDAGQLTHFRILGRAEIGDREYRTTASTVPALRKLFPLMVYPPAELDGWIALGVRSATKAPDRKSSE